MEKRLQKSFNEQIKNEMYSAYLYLAMAAYFESINLEGFSHWMKVQVKEEMGHVMRIFDFLNDRGVRVILDSIPKPPAEFSSPESVFKAVLEHERKITGLINRLYGLAKELKDNSSCVFLQWFITEQVEEEKTATKILETLKAIGKQPVALIMFDRELAKRGGE
jgi:ferritin